jgi:hypothetical protein
MVVPLTGVSNQQYVTIAVSGIAAADGGSGGSGSVRLGFLLGDVSQNRVVTVSDLALVNAQVAQVVAASNFLKDVNVSGTLSIADKGITKRTADAGAGHALSVRFGLTRFCSHLDDAACCVSDDQLDVRETRLLRRRFRLPRRSPCRPRPSSPCRRCLPCAGADGSARTRSIAATIGSRRVRMSQVLEHQRARPDLADRIRDALAGDVGRRAVHRLEQRRELALGIDVADGAMPIVPAGRAEVRQDVAEEVRADDDVEALGCARSRARMSMWYWSVRRRDSCSPFARSARPSTAS